MTAEQVTETLIPTEVVSTNGKLPRKQIVFKSGLPSNFPDEPSLAERADDPVGRYMREIRRNPLLTAQEQIKLGRQKNLGELASQQLKDEYPNCDPFSLGNDEVAPQPARELVALVREGAAAKRQLTLSNLCLVVSIAKKYKRYTGMKMDLFDLIQEGNIGLIRAVERFDGRPDCKLSSYAVWWIRVSIDRAIADRDRTIRLPGYMVGRLTALRRAQTRLSQERGRDPTYTELGTEEGLSEQQVCDAFNAGQHPLSLDQPVREDGLETLADSLPDERSLAAPEKLAVEARRRQAIDSVLGLLPAREAEVIRLRFGLIDDQKSTLVEIGEKLGMTGEAVRLIEKKALEKLRHPSRRKLISKFKHD